MNHYRCKTTRRPRVARLLATVCFDVRDLRTGYRESSTALYRVLDDPQLDSVWGREAMERLEEDSLEPFRPPEEVAWPKGADEKILQYLVAHVRFPLFRHPSLGLYSQRDESKEDFVERCREAMAEDLSERLRRVREMFLPRLIEAERRWREQAEAQDWDENSRSRRMAEIEGFFASLHEELANLVIREERTELPEGLLESHFPLDPLMLEQFEDLRTVFISKYNQVLDEYDHAASEIEEDEAAPSLSQIEIVSRDILWD